MHGFTVVVNDGFCICVSREPEIGSLVLKTVFGYVQGAYTVTNYWSENKITSPDFSLLGECLGLFRNFLKHDACKQLRL